MLLPDVRYQGQLLVLDASGVGSARGKGRKVMAIEAVQARDGPLVTDLVTRAIGGDSHAWDALVERYIPLVWSICRVHRLDHADARTVNQTVWLQLADQLGTLRNPAALTGWLAATTHRECDRIRRAAHQRPDHGQLPEAAIVPDEPSEFDRSRAMYWFSENRNTSRCSTRSSRVRPISPHCSCASTSRTVGGSGLAATRRSSLRSVPLYSAFHTTRRRQKILRLTS